jgi:hypothetical protein
MCQASEKKGEQYDRRQGPAANRGPDGSFQIRLLIPRASAGVLIGKGGAIIKQMIDQSHCRMQMGEEADPYSTNERILILNASSTHELANVSHPRNRSARLIFVRILTHVNFSFFVFLQGAIEVMNMLHSQPKFRVYSNPTASYSDVAVGGGTVQPAPGTGSFQSAGGRSGASHPPMHHAGQGAVGPTMITNVVPGVPGGVPGMMMPLPGVVYTTAPVAYPPPYPAAAYTITAVGGGGGGGAPAGRAVGGGGGGGGSAPAGQSNWGHRQGPPLAQQGGRGAPAPSARSQPATYASQHAPMANAGGAAANGSYPPQQYAPVCHFCTTDLFYVLRSDLHYNLPCR